METEIKAQIEYSVYKEHLELMEIALDVDKISKTLTKLRGDKQALGY